MHAKAATQWRQLQRASGHARVAPQRGIAGRHDRDGLARRSQAWQATGWLATTQRKALFQQAMRRPGGGCTTLHTSGVRGPSSCLRLDHRIESLRLQRPKQARQVCERARVCVYVCTRVCVVCVGFLVRFIHSCAYTPLRPKENYTAVLAAPCCATGIINIISLSAQCMSVLFWLSLTKVATVACRCDHAVAP